MRVFGRPVLDARRGSPRAFRVNGDVAVSGWVLPDLRYSGASANQQWFSIVMDGMLDPYGMVGFSKEVSREDAEAIRAYVIFRANQSLAEKQGNQK